MDELLAELQSLTTGEQFRYSLDDLMASWKARGVGLDGVEAGLAFVEAHPDLDYGMPGALVHFAERFYRKGYEAALLRSFARRPTALTAWMVNRLLNGASDDAECETYVAALEAGEANATTDPATRAEIAAFLDRSA